MKTLSILFVGVGGEGIISSGTILGNALTKKSINVVMSELHGMAQRGGIVSVEVKIGNSYNPIIANHSADIIVGFEAVETYRALSKAHADTIIILNRYKIIPFTVAVGMSSYPELDTIISTMRKFYSHTYVLDALTLAKQAGNSMAQNIVLLGALLALDKIPVSKEDLIESIKEVLPPRYLQTNVQALILGLKQMQKLLHASVHA